MDERNKPPLKAMTLEECVKELSQGLLPGEDALFYDINRFGKPRPAPPSEQVIYEPPTQIATEQDPVRWAEQCARARTSDGEEEHATVVLDTSLSESLGDETRKISPAPNPRDIETSPDAAAIANKKRATARARKQTKELIVALSIAIAGLAGVWFVLTPGSRVKGGASAASQTPASASPIARALAPALVDTGAAAPPTAAEVRTKAPTSQKLESASRSHETYASPGAVSPLPTSTTRAPMESRRATSAPATSTAPKPSGTEDDDLLLFTAPKNRATSRH